MDIVKVTSIDELKVMSQGELVELPPFIAGQKFVARLRRPSMMGLIQKGKIPNNLLRAANSLFTNKVEEEADLDDAFLKDVLGIIDILADASFIEPTWAEIKEAGIELTDDQYMAIFNYSQNGIRALEPFRQVTEDTTDN